MKGKEGLITVSFVLIGAMLAVGFIATSILRAKGVL